MLLIYHFYFFRGTYSLFMQGMIFREVEALWYYKEGIFWFSLRRLLQSSLKTIKGYSATLLIVITLYFFNKWKKAGSSVLFIFDALSRWAVDGVFTFAETIRSRQLVQMLLPRHRLDLVRIARLPVCGRFERPVRRLRGFVLDVSTFLPRKSIPGSITFWGGRPCCWSPFSAIWDTCCA